METEARLFADYEPDPPARVEQASLWCRIAARGDEAAVAALIVARDGGALDETEAALLDGWIPSRVDGEQR